MLCRHHLGVDRRNGTLILTRVVNVVEVEDLRVHHDLPCVNGQVSIVERPVERLFRLGLVGRVVVRSEVWMCERFSGADTCAGVENEHLFEQIQCHRVGVLELLREGDALALGQRLDESERVLGADGLDDLIWWGTEQLSNDGELVDVVLAWEERLAFEHLCKDASCTPHVNSHVVFLPGEHDLGGTVVTCADVAGHLRVLDTGETEIADLEIAVLVDENVAGLQVTVDYTCRVHVLETSEDLVQEILDELLLKRSACEQSVKIGTKELGNKVAVGNGRFRKQRGNSSSQQVISGERISGLSHCIRASERSPNLQTSSVSQRLSKVEARRTEDAKGADTHMSSRGEIKMSLRLIIC